MWFIDLVVELCQLWLSWRFFVCLLVSVSLAILLHSRFEGQVWVWFISVPMVVGSLVLGWWWQERADAARG